MVIIDRWSLYRNTVSNNPLIKWSLCTGFLKKSICQIWCENYLGQNQPFTKFVEAANKLMKLVEVGKYFMKLVKFANNLTEFVEFANNFMKFIEFTNNFMKFVRLTKKLLWSLQKLRTTLQSSWDLPIKVRKTCKNFMKLVNWKVGFKYLKAFLYLGFTH